VGSFGGSTATPLQCNAADGLKSVPSVHTTAGITYNERGQPLLATYANGMTATYTYDTARGWLNSVTHAKGGTVLANQTYVRDAKGRVTSVTNSANAKDSWAYKYDGRC
jgi:YD repeat-containing protein